MGLVAASGRALHFLVSLGEPCLCLLSQCVSVCVELLMLPQHLFASPVVMFTKSKFKYMSCGGKVINMHVEMLWSLDVPVRGGAGLGEKGLGRCTLQCLQWNPETSPCHRKGRQCWPLSLCQDSALPLSCCPHGQGAWRCLPVRAVPRVPISASPPLA